jgi:preprotein translocase subunit SecG
MGIVSVILLIVFVIACALLVLVVLIQDEQGEGLGGLFSGSSASFGPRKGNVLTRFTSILGIVFLVGAFAVAWLNRTPEIGDVVRKARLEQLQTSQDSAWWVQTDKKTTATPPAQSGTDANAAQPAAESGQQSGATTSTQGQ